MEFIDGTLNLYGKTLNSLLFIVGDNCKTNKKIADLCNVPFVGCASHRLNLAVKQFCASFETTLGKINQLMSKLQGIKQAAKLRRFTDLTPVKRNVTRWTSTYSMIKRYFELLAFIDCRDSDLVPFIPTRREEDELRQKLEALEDFHSVCLSIQSSSLNLLQVRRLFDALILKYPQTSFYLSPTARIIKHQSFESGIVKLLSGQDTLTVVEQALLSKFKTSASSSDETVSFAESVLKKPMLSTYQDLKYIPPTSNHVERFFSSAKLVVTDLRKSMYPKTLEMLLFLKYNSYLWDEKQMKLLRAAMKK